MALHDWTRVDAGLFHHFHHRWTDAICDALNSGGLPRDYFALVEQRIRGPIPDVLTLKVSSGGREPSSETVGLAVATAPPKARVVRRSEPEIYARRANRIVVRHRHGDIVAVVEIVSPGNKATRAELRSFVTKAADLIHQGVHLLVLDVHPPGPYDRCGIHKVIWDEFVEEDFELDGGKTLVLAAYDAGPEKVAYVELVGVGDLLPDMPLFLEPGVYVPTPLQAAYDTTWGHFPTALKELLEPGAGPGGSHSAGAPATP